MILAIFISHIITNAVGDGLNQSGRKDWGHLIKAMSVLILLVSPFIIGPDNIVLYILGYALMRESLFDFIRNKVTGESLGHIGTSGFRADIINKFKPPLSGLIFARIILLGVAISIILRYN